MWIEYTLPEEVSKRFHIFNPLLVQVATSKTNSKVNDILGRVPEGDYVLIPTLHSGALDKDVE